MRTCLNTATTRGKPLADDIRLCGEFGFEGIEIDTGKLDEFLDGCRVEDLRGLLDDCRVACAGVMAFAFRPFGDAAEQLERIRRYGPICRALGGEVLLAFISDRLPEGMERAEAVERAGEVARAYAEAAAESGCRVALEPIGRASFMDTPAEALAVVEAAGHPALGIMVDTFHAWKSDVLPEDVRKLPGERVLIVHINDAEDVPPEQATDANRLYPGEGILPLAGYLDALRAIGYDGFLSMELFRPEYWADEHATIIRRAKEQLDAVLTR
ncbi:MAG: sugar phosphate isomerase/epimerase family protein [Armatimonadota bacterium]